MERDPAGKERENPLSSAAGCALFAIGLLILVPSGLCAVTLLPLAISGDPNGANILFSPSDFYVFGAIAAVGAALVYAGRKLRRRDD